MLPQGSLLLNHAPELSTGFEYKTKLLGFFSVIGGISQRNQMVQKIDILALYLPEATLAAVLIEQMSRDKR